jgi:hypothetical protein
VQNGYGVALSNGLKQFGIEFCMIDRMSSAGNGCCDREAQQKPSHTPGECHTLPEYRHRDTSTCHGVIMRSCNAAIRTIGNQSTSTVETRRLHSNFDFFRFTLHLSL